MSQHIDDMMAEWLAGSLSAEQEEQCVEHISSCARCAAEFQAATRDFVNLAVALQPAVPSKNLRARIFENARPEARFEDLAKRVAALIDVSTRRALEYLGGIDRDESWNAGLLPGVEVFHLDGGPSVEDAIVGFIRIKPGAGFPEHEHAGAETTLVLQGSYRDGDGTTYRRGQEFVEQPGTLHEFAALPGPPLIYLTVAQQGIYVGEIYVGPQDPRL